MAGGHAGVITAILFRGAANSAALSKVQLISWPAKLDYVIAAAELPVTSTAGHRQALRAADEEAQGAGEEGQVQSAARRVCRRRRPDGSAAGGVGGSLRRASGGGAGGWCHSTGGHAGSGCRKPHKFGTIIPFSSSSMIKRQRHLQYRAARLGNAGLSLAYKQVSPNSLICLLLLIVLGCR